MRKLSQVLKAVVGFVAPGAVVIGASVTAPSDGGTAITQAELVTAGVACVVTAAGVWATPNDLLERLARRRSSALDDEPGPGYNPPPMSMEAQQQLDAELRDIFREDEP